MRLINAIIESANSMVDEFNNVENPKISARNKRRAAQRSLKKTKNS